MKNKTPTLGTWLFGSPLIAAYLAYVVFAESYVCSRLWGWYIAPLGLIALQWRTFLGASLLRGVFMLRSPRERGVDTRTSGEIATAQVAYWAAPWLCLFVGWWFK